MEQRFSLAKVARPGISGVLLRSRLFALFDRATAPVVWITAMAGAGKTTLVTSYIDETDQSCLWYRVDEGDRDAASFFHYMGLAAEQAAPSPKKSLPVFGPEYLPSLNLFTRRFFDALFRKLKRPHLLVFDNYQDAGEKSVLHDIIGSCAAMLPPGFRIIILSRKPPEPAFSALQAGKDLAWIGPDEIRFTSDESNTLVSMSGRTDLSDAESRQVHEITDGWAAGITLVLRSADRGSIAEAARSGMASQPLFDYFSGEVLRRMPEAHRQLLVRSAFFPELTPAMADEFMASSGTEAILNELHRDHFFVTKQESSGMFVYHALLREYLLARAQHELGAREYVQLQRKAAMLLERDGRIESAAELHLQLADADEIIRILSQHAPTLLFQGRSSVVQGWIDRLPHDVVGQKPALLFWKGACLLAIDPVGSREHFKKAFILFRTAGDRIGVFLSWCAVVDTAIHECVYVHMKDWINVLHEVLTEQPGYPSEEIEARVQMSLFNAVAFGQPDHPDIGTIRGRAFVLFCNGKITDPALALSTGLHLLVHYMYQGDMSKAGIVRNLLSQAALTGQATDLVRIFVGVSGAHYDFFIGELDVCIEEAKKALAFADDRGVHLWDFHLLGHSISASLSRGDKKTADELIAKLAGLLGCCRTFDKVYYYSLLSWKAMLDEDFIQAQQLLEFAWNLNESVGFLAPDINARIIMAEILHEQGKSAEADACLERAWPFVESTGSAYLLYIYRTIESYIQFQRGNRAKALESLEQAFSLGRRNRLFNMFLCRPSRMALLCEQALEHGIEAAYARELVLKLRLRPSQTSAPISAWPWPLSLSTLGTFKVQKEGEAVSFSRRSPEKQLGLLRLLITSAREGISEQEAVDALWPDADGDAAHNAFSVTLQRLRKLIGADVLRLRGGRLSLIADSVYIDAWAFEDLHAGLEGRGEQALKRALQAINLYQGEFLGSSRISGWELSYRERLHVLFQKCIRIAGTILEEQGKLRQAIEIYERGLAVDDLIEELYQRIMLIKRDLGLNADGINAYHRCSKILSKRLGIAPSPETVRIYKSLL